MHGTSIAKTWERIDAKSRNSSAQATISLNPTTIKSSQYIVINGQRLLDSPLYQIINKRFHEGDTGYSVSETGSKYPAYIIDIRYPVSVKDYVLDPRRCIYSSDVSEI